jgi:Spy/CpxP family protein refolding chaperone
MKSFIESLKELLNDESLTKEQKEQIEKIIQEYKIYQESLISEMNEILRKI